MEYHLKLSCVIALLFLVKGSHQALRKKTEFVKNMLGVKKINLGFHFGAKSEPVKEINKDTSSFPYPSEEEIQEMMVSENSDEVSILVKVNNEIGMQYVKDNAIKVNMENEDAGLIGVTILKEKVESILQNSNVGEPETDHFMFLSRKPTSLRKLADEEEQQQPWGIPLVLQDLEFWENIPDPIKPLKICVADTGYDLNHEDLPKEPDVNGTNNYGDNWYEDGNSHGTHVAGTVAGLGNEKGVYGVIPNNKGGKFQLLIGKALSNNGSGTASGVISAVQHCVDQGANVISMSLGCNTCPTQTEESFYEGLYDKGILLVAAAGNSGNSVMSYPASYSSVMSVASLTQTITDPIRSSFSQYNSQVEISAPGANVLSTKPDDVYDFLSGTSMATPHVSGVAGLVWMYFPDCTNIQIRHVLAYTAKNVGPRGCEDEYGYGLIQAKSAYDYLLQDGNCGGDLGPDEPVGGCEELFGTPAPTPAPCTSDASCDDGISCTDDICDLDTGLCSYVSLVTEIVKVNITTDDYPDETKWEITSSRDPYNPLMFGGDYTESGTSYTKKESLLACGETYKFMILDSSEDGMCCDYGQGKYVLTVQGDVVAEGGEFDRMDEVMFTVGEKEPTTAPSLQSSEIQSSDPSMAFTSLSPIPLPTSSPFTSQSSPISALTSAPVSNSELSNCILLTFSLTTDKFGYETSFTLVNDYNGGIRRMGGSYPSSSTIHEVTCLTEGRYIFTIFDSYGDGICCGEQGNGSYKLTLGGNIIREGNEFGKLDKVIFDVGPPAPTRAPTLAPSCLSSTLSCSHGDQCCSGRCRIDACD